LYFRQALEDEMNQQAVIDGPLRGYGTVTVGPVGTVPATQWLSPQGMSGNPFPFDLSQAKSLLTSHGWNVVPNGIKLNLQPKPFAQVISTAGGNCVAAKLPCNWDMANWGGGWSFSPDYDPTGEQLFLSDVVANSGGYSGPADDSLINKTLTNPQPAVPVQLAELCVGPAPDDLAAERGLPADRGGQQPQGRHAAEHDAQHQPGELVLHEVTGPDRAGPTDGSLITTRSWDGPAEPRHWPRRPCPAPSYRDLEVLRASPHTGAPLAEDHSQWLLLSGGNGRLGITGIARSGARMLLRKEHI
jgi:hypothetical protein